MKTLENDLFNDIERVDEFFKDLKNLSSIKLDKSGKYRKVSGLFEKEINNYIINNQTSHQMPDLYVHNKIDNLNQYNQLESTIIFKIEKTEQKGYLPREIFLLYNKEAKKYKCNTLSYQDENNNILLLSKDFGAYRIKIIGNNNHSANIYISNKYVNFETVSNQIKQLYEHHEKNGLGKDFINYLFQIKKYSQEELDLQKLNYDCNIEELSCCNKVITLKESSQLEENKNINRESKWKSLLKKYCQI